MPEHARSPFSGTPELHGRGSEATVWRFLNDRGRDASRFIVKAMRRDGLWGERVSRDPLAVAKELRHANGLIAAHLPRRMLPETHFLIGEDPDDGAPTVLIAQERIEGTTLGSFLHFDTPEEQRALGDQVDRMLVAALTMWDRTQRAGYGNVTAAVTWGGSVGPLPAGTGLLPEVAKLDNVLYGRRARSRAPRRLFLIDTHSLIALQHRDLPKLGALIESTFDIMLAWTKEGSAGHSRSAQRFAAMLARR